MRAVRYQTEMGMRHALLLDEDRAKVRVVLMEYPLQVRRLKRAETRYMTEVDTRSAVRAFRRAAKDWHGGLRGLPAGVREALR